MTRSSHVDIVLEELLDEFDRGEIRPGERINAAHISARLGISRGPVREALAILSGRGLIRLEKDRGATLRPMSPDDVIKIWQMFEVTVGLGVRLAGDNIHTPGAAERVRAAMSDIYKCARTEKTFRFYLVLNDFHFVLNSISGNPHINEVLEKMNVAYWNRYLADLIDVGATADQYVENYRRIADGVLAGDGASAQAAWSFHVRWSVAKIRETVEAREKG